MFEVAITQSQYTTTAEGVQREMLFNRYQLWGKRCGDQLTLGGGERLSTYVTFIYTDSKDSRFRAEFCSHVDKSCLTPTRLQKVAEKVLKSAAM